MVSYGATGLGRPRARRSDYIGQGAYGGGSSPSVEADVVLQISFDGANGSQTFVDDAGRHTPAAVDNAQLSTSVKKYGTASLICDGTADEVQVSENADWDHGTDDFTHEFWFYVPTSVFAHNVCMYSAHQYAGPAQYLSLWTLNSPTPYVFCDIQANDTTRYTASIAAPAVYTWHHWAYVRNGNTLTGYLNGVSSASWSVTGKSFDFGTVVGGADGFVYLGSGGRAYFSNIQIDEYRLSRAAKYTANFTPPTAPF